MIFIILIFVVILTIVIISTISIFFIIEKEHNRLLDIFFNSKSIKDLITFINYIFHRDKFKRFKFFFYKSNQI